MLCVMLSVFSASRWSLLTSDVLSLILLSGTFDAEHSEPFVLHFCTMTSVARSNALSRMASKMLTVCKTLFDWLSSLLRRRSPSAIISTSLFKHFFVASAATTLEFSVTVPMR
uniref:Putative secreted protein ovary overexpressed n=1 Tax=Rhipicephalus microplus TaxID=6941 RepID=A0A6M2DBZ1_RHIMP